MDTKVVEVTNSHATGAQLSSGLQGTYKERMEEEKTLLLQMSPGQRPTVVFTGFWNYRFIKAAMNSIARAYRTRRHKPTRGNVPENPPARGEGGLGDV